MNDPQSQLLAVERLCRFRKNLNQNKFHWASNCLGKYLDGEALSLDEAFGVKQTRRRGAPGNPAQREQVAREIFAMHYHDKKSWKEIADFFFEKKISASITDVRTIRRIYDEFFVKLVAEKIAKDMTAD